MLKELENENLSIFAGAGLSRGSGFVDWKELLRDIASELELDIDKEYDLVSIAQYHYNVRGRQAINQAVVEEFQRTAEENENMNILSRLPINTYWTTNYDSIIEDTLKKEGKVIDVKVKQTQMKYFTPNRNAVIFKMHGDKAYPDDVVITRDDFESYNNSRNFFTTQLKGELVSRTFLFIGFSFEDPNLEQILSKVRVDLMGDSPKDHYCFLRRVQSTDERYRKQGGTYDKDEYNYDKIKQDLKIKDLMRYGINTVLIDEYPQITEILKSLENKMKLKNIFISGSASEYGEYTEEKAKNLLHVLSSHLVSKENHIISGFGLGVGSYVINGALEEGFKRSFPTNNYLTLRPFPQKESGQKSMRELWTDYRIDMLKNAGIAIFVFGNKIENGELTIANGTLEEFEIAKKHNIYIIPLGSTGYATKQILDEMKKDLEKYWYLKDSIESLEFINETKDIIKEVDNIIERIKRRNNQ